ncbi:Dipeptidyl peptidase 3 [Lamellibrachia satsuma]|nr:Dipeptidyl peptidase 3 [Lamellibrachia satsuma]
MQARYGILQVLLEAGEGLVSLERIVGEDSEPDLLVTLDRSKINSVGKTAIGDFLKKLQLYKSTADYKSGKALYDRYTNVCENMLSLRDIVLKRKQPRKMFVQCHTVIKDDDIDLVSFESSPEGLIQSFVTRFPPSCGINNELEELWEKDAPHFS